MRNIIKSYQNIRKLSKHTKVIKYTKHYRNIIETLSKHYNTLQKLRNINETNKNTIRNIIKKLSKTIPVLIPKTGAKNS